MLAFYGTTIRSIYIYIYVAPNQQFANRGHTKYTFSLTALRQLQQNYATDFRYWVLQRKLVTATASSQVFFAHKVKRFEIPVNKRKSP